jgi:hypothetical protein
LSIPLTLQVVSNHQKVKEQLPAIETQYEVSFLSFVGTNAIEIPDFL